MEIITTAAEQHNPDLSNSMNIQSGSSPDTRTNKPLIPTPKQTPRPSDRSATNILPVSFQSDPSRPKAFTGDVRDGPATTTSLGLLNLPSDLLPLITETRPPAISSKALTIPSMLTGVDDMLSKIDIDTVSSLDWIMTPESDRPLVTSWNALSETDSLPLGLAPTTTAESLAETLSTPETHIIVSIPTGGSSHNHEDSVDQKSRSAAHMVPLQAQGSYQSLSTPYTHQLSYHQPASLTPTQAIDTSSRGWQKVSVTRTPAKPLITPLFSSHVQMVYNGGSLNAITKGETVLVSSTIPTSLNKHDGGGLFLPPTNTPSSRSRKLAKTEEICDSGSSGTTPAKPTKEDRTTSTSLNMVPENPEITEGAPRTPNGPDQRPSTTTTPDTATRSVDTDSMFDQLRRGQPITRQSVAVSAGATSAGIAVFILTFVLHRFVYRWVGRRRTGVIWIGREPNANRGSRIELLQRMSQNPEVSYFSDGS